MHLNWAIDGIEEPLFLVPGSNGVGADGRTIFGDNTIGLSAQNA